MTSTSYTGLAEARPGRAIPGHPLAGRTKQQKQCSYCSHLICHEVAIAAGCIVSLVHVVRQADALVHTYQAPDNGQQTLSSSAVAVWLL